MSTRFTMAPDQGLDAPPMPPMPSMPSIPSGPGAKLPPVGGRRKGSGVDIDINVFKSPAFNPDQCEDSYTLGERERVGADLCGG